MTAPRHTLNERRYICDPSTTKGGREGCPWFASTSCRYAGVGRQTEARHGRHAHTPGWKRVTGTSRQGITPGWKRTTREARHEGSGEAIVTTLWTDRGTASALRDRSASRRGDLNRRGLAARRATRRGCAGAWRRDEGITPALGLGVGSTSRRGGASQRRRRGLPPCPSLGGRR